MTTGIEVTDRVHELIGAMAPRRNFAFTANSRLIEDMGFDSLRLMELTVVLERAFGLASFRPEELAGVRRVGQVVDLISGALREQA